MQVYTHGHRRFAMPKSVHVITSHIQKASRIVQNGACTQKQAFVYRVLCSHHALHTARCSRLSCFWTFVRSAHFFSCSVQFQNFLIVFIDFVQSFFFKCVLRVLLYTEGKQDVRTLSGTLPSFHSFIVWDWSGNTLGAVPAVFLHSAPSKHTI